MTTLSAAKARSNFASLLKKAAAGEVIGIRYGKKVLPFSPSMMTTPVMRKRNMA